MRRAGLAVLFLARLAHADDPHDTFGFKKPAQDQPLDCSDGHAIGCSTATDPFSDLSPYGLWTWLPSSYLQSLPVANANQDDVANYVLGGYRDATGAAFAGATGLENRWTVEGAPTDGIRTGASDTHVPLIFLDGMTVTTGGFTAHDRASTGGTIDARLIKGGDHHVVDTYAWLGWQADGASTPPVPNEFTVRTGNVASEPSLALGGVARGPIGSFLGGRAWYAAGIAPTFYLSTFDFSSHKLVDVNGDSIPDGFPGIVDTTPIDSFSHRNFPYFVPAMARAGWDRDHHHVEISLLGQVTHDERDIFNATIQATGIDRTSYTGDAIATYRGEWDDTHVHVVAAWHRSMLRESAHDPAAADIPQQLSAYIPTQLPDDQALADACAATRTPKFDPCPVPTSWFFWGGAGFLQDTTADRTSITADIAHRWGANVVRAGATSEDSRFVNTERYTGGEEILSLFDGQADAHRFFDPSQPCDPATPGSPCTYLDAETVTYRTRYTAGYVEDTLTLAPGLVADAGLRYEFMEVGNAFHLGEPAPRLGLSWDVLGGGRSRVWVSMGRTYPYLTAGIGSTVVQRFATVDDQTSPFGPARAVDPGGVLPISTFLQAPYQDELTTGAVFTPLPAFRFEGYLQGLWLRRGFDTILDASFDNPGRTGVAPEAERNTVIVGLEIAFAPAQQVDLRAGWAYGHTVGTWTGAYDPQQGVVLYGGTDYDADFRNMAGALPTDFGHDFYFEGQKRGHIAGYPVGVSTRLSLQSGTPRDYLADSETGLIELLPRGSGPRLPMVTTANLRLFARVAGCDIRLDLFDVFDRQATTLTDEIYVGGEQSVTPIVGGSAEDLVWLKTASGTIPTRHDGYNFATAFQAPFAAVLGVHRSF